MVDKKKAQEIYDKIQHKLKGHEGEIIAIEVDSEDYFLGKNSIEAIQKARARYPDKNFYFLRVGYRAAFFVGSVAK